MAAILVLTTESSLPNARKLASHLIKKRLAACVSISSAVESHYVWKGKAEKSREFMLFIKTRKKLFSSLQKEILKHHSYDNPEVLEIPAGRISKKYLKWLEGNTVSR